MLTGDRIFASLIGLFGVVWIVQSRHLTYWGEFAPGSGFLPIWLGIVLVALVAAYLVASFRDPVLSAAAPSRPRHVGAIALGLIVCIGLLEWLGFVVSVALYLAFLVGWLERRPLRDVAIVSLGASVGLWLIFKAWLKVPFPEGPWGF
jgi:putative tricarboxylic transport membrane protein